MRTSRIISEDEKSLTRTEYADDLIAHRRGPQQNGKDRGYVSGCEMKSTCFKFKFGIAIQDPEFKAPETPPYIVRADPCDSVSNLQPAIPEQICFFFGVWCRPTLMSSKRPTMWHGGSAGWVFSCCFTLDPVGLICR